MRKLVEMELYKLIKNKSIITLIAILVIPVMMSIAVATNSYIGEKNQSALIWLSTQLFNSNALFIAPIVISTISARLLAKEIENKSIQLYVPRINDRRLIYRSKLIAIIIFTTCMYLIAAILIVGTYYLIVIHNQEIGSGRLTGGYQVAENIVSIVLLYLYNCFIIPSVLLCFASKFKTFASIAFASAIIVISQYLYQFAPLAKYLTPWFYILKLINAIDTNRSYTNIELSMNYLLINGILCAVILIVSYKVGYGYFKKRDL